MKTYQYIYNDDVINVFFDTFDICDEMKLILISFSCWDGSECISSFECCLC